MPRGARPDEARQVRTLILSAIDEVPFYDEQFRRFEKDRFSEAFIRTLIALDPWHVCVVTQGTDVIGIAVTIPEYGTLWSPWIYVKPQFRTSATAVTLIRSALKYWDNNRFHKISCYVHPENRTALTIFRRFGFKKIAYLENHIFGNGFILMERPLTKTNPTYDSGTRLRRLERLKIKLAILFGR